MASIVNSEASSTSLFQSITTKKKDKKSISSVLVNSKTTTRNNSITDLNALWISFNELVFHITFIFKHIK
ncbi:unnamed protein product, partial [Rotaria sp. Silwood1]